MILGEKSIGLLYSGHLSSQSAWNFPHIIVGVKIVSVAIITVAVVRFLTSSDSDDYDQKSHDYDSHYHADNLGSFVSGLKLLFKFFFI